MVYVKEVKEEHINMKNEEQFATSVRKFYVWRTFAIFAWLNSQIPMDTNMTALF